MWGCSLVVKPQSSKLMMRVRFSSSPPLICSYCLRVASCPWRIARPLMPLAPARCRLPALRGAVRVMRISPQQMRGRRRCARVPDARASQMCARPSCAGVAIALSRGGGSASAEGVVTPAVGTHPPPRPSVSALLPGRARNSGADERHRVRAAAMRVAVDASTGAGRCERSSRFGGQNDPETRTSESKRGTEAPMCTPKCQLFSGGQNSLMYPGKFTAYPGIRTGRRWISHISGVSTV